MRTVTICLVVILSASAHGADVSTEFMQGLGDTRYHRVMSDELKRGFHVYVGMPADIDASSDRRYPTVYLLDGGALYPMLSAYYRYLRFAEEVPDAIVVGIAYGTASFKDGNYRSTDYTASAEERDYWGGAGQFQRFLGRELLPFIESTYPADADRRIVFGQSLGGQFVLYTAMTAPDLFWGHIASNPALHRNLPFFLKPHAATTPGNTRQKLFVASGTDDDPRFREPAVAWIQHWSDVDDRPWRLKTVHLDGHSHMSAPPAAFRQGMRWLFAKE